MLQAVTVTEGQPKSYLIRFCSIFQYIPFYSSFCMPRCLPPPFSICPSAQLLSKMPWISTTHYVDIKWSNLLIQPWKHWKIHRFKFMLAFLRHDTYISGSTLRCIWSYWSTASGWPGWIRSAKRTGPWTINRNFWIQGRVNVCVWVFQALPYKIGVGNYI